MTKPMTKVEQVARALCAHDDYDPDGPGVAGSTAEFMWQHYRGFARAAIEAMRVPTLAMRKVCRFEVAEVDYPAMIDAALSEEGE